MATMARPLDPRDEPRRPNIATADVQLPAVRDYEQVDREIIATLNPTFGWFAALGTAILCLLIGALCWTYQIHEGLKAIVKLPSLRCRLKAADVYDRIEFDGDSSE